MNKNRIRYRQRDFHLDELDNIINLKWTIEDYGCGPTSIANVLVNLGFSINPIDVTKKILFDKSLKFDTTYIKNRGISPDGLIYCLDRLINEDGIDITYEIVKIDFNNPLSKKQKIIDMMKNGYMAIIHVGPSQISPLSFSQNGHYLVLSDIDDKNNFYVINSNKIGDEQLGVSFDYDTIIKNIYGRKDSFNFILIGRK